MKKLKITPKNWKDISILTNSPSDKNKTLITGYSKEPLSNGDTITTQTNFKYTIVEETERRDAKGNWENGEEKNRWFKATATIKNLNP